MLKKWLPPVLKFAVSGLLIWLLLTKVDVDAALDRLLEVAPEMVLLSALVFLVQILICVFRWRAVLTAIGVPLPFLTAFRLYFIGIFFNQTLPSSVGGDAVRMYMTYRAGLTMGAAVNSVMLERVATVVGLVILVAVTLPVFVTRVDEQTGTWMVPAVALLGVATVAGLAFLMILERLPDSLRKWRIVRGIANLGADARRLFLVPMNAGKTLGWAVVGHANVALGVFVLALGLDLDVTWVDCMALVPPVILVTTLPISIAGWGVREGAMVVAFGFIGVADHSALVLSLLMGLVVIAISLPGGVVWLLSADRRRAAEDQSGMSVGSS
jgi:glycosyltransferase 2 family protein